MTLPGPEAAAVSTARLRAKTGTLSSTAIVAAQRRANRRRCTIGLSRSSALSAHAELKDPQYTDRDATATESD
jgi:hypothetical protein